LLAAFRGWDWDRAEVALQQLRQPAAAFGLETLLALYGARIAAYRVAPPPQGWDGVYQATNK